MVAILSMMSSLHLNDVKSTEHSQRVDGQSLQIQPAREYFYADLRG